MDGTTKSCDGVMPALPEAKSVWAAGGDVSGEPKRGGPQGWRAKAQGPVEVRIGWAARLRRLERALLSNLVNLGALEG
jgi:hypothetical protein